MLQSHSHRETVLRFLERQSAGKVPAPTIDQQLDELARHVIDVMAVRDCHEWNTEIAWQSARETLSSTSDHECEKSSIACSGSYSRNDHCFPPKAWFARADRADARWPIVRERGPRSNRVCPTLCQNVVQY
jgi:hypothetical protein